MRTGNMSQSIEPKQSATDHCDGSSTELSKAMATLSVNNTPRTNTASKQFNNPPAESSTTPLFGSSGSVPLFGTCSTPPSGSSSLFRVTGKPASGASTGSTLFSVANTPESSGAKSTPLFGVPKTQSSLFGAPQTSTLFSGAPKTPLFGQSQSSAPAYNSPGFGFGASSSPTLFGASNNKPALFGTPSSIPNAPQYDPFHVSAKPAFSRMTTTTTGGSGATSACAPEFGFGAVRPFEGYINPYYGMRCSPCPGRRDLHLPISGFSSWSLFWKDPERISSICAMLACGNIGMSYEWPRWYDCCRCSEKGEPNKPSHVNYRIGDSTDSDLITIKIKVPSRVASQILEAIRALHINADSCSTSHCKSAPMFGIPF